MVPALAFFGAGVAGAGAGAIIASVIVSSVINYAIATVLGQLLAPSNPHSGKNTRGLQRNIKSNIAPRTVVYGRCNVGGPFLQISTGGQTNDYLNIIIALAGHPIEDVVGVFFNEEYINIEGDIGVGSNQLDSGYYVKSGKFGTTATDSPKYQSTRIVKVLGWGFADFNYVTDGTQTKCSDDRTRANAIDTFSGVDFTWNPPGGGIRDSQTGLYPEGEKATNCAYIYIQLKYNPEVFSGGIPKFKFHVKGKHLYNPYLDGTKVAEGAVSGSAPHRLNDPDTWEYSDDWTLTLLDYLINDQFGLGAKTTGTTADPEEIDWVEAIASYTVSSEIISAGRPSPFTTTVPRYRTNGVFDVSSTPVSIVEGLLSGANGELIYAQGKYKIRPAIYRLPNSPNDIINEDDIVGNLTIRTHTPRSELFNKASGVFIDKGFAEGSEPGGTSNVALYEPADFNTVDPVDSSGNNPYVVADGEEIVKEFDYPYVTDRYTAQRLARISLERIRRGISVSFEGTMNLIKYSVGDTVYLEILSDSRYANEAFFNRLGLDDTVQNRPDSPGTAYYKQFKIVDMQYTENSTIAITMIEEAEEIYDWQAGFAVDSDETLTSGIPGDNPNSDILVPDFNVASPFQTVEEIIGTETGTTVTTLLRWSAPIRSSANEDVLDIKNIGSYRIEYGVVDNPSQANAENRVSVWIPKGTRLADIGNVTQGPVSFESLYKDGVDYDFRIASITHTGRQSEFAYYSDFAGSDYTPTQSAAAAQSVRTVNMYNLNDNTIAEASGGTFQVPISSGNAADGWSLNVPSMTANGDIIYVTTRTFTDDAQSPQDPAWASPTIYAQRVDGTQGLTVSLTADKLAFTYDSNGNNPESPAVANFTATSFNFDSAEEYRFLVDGVEQSPGWTTDNTFTYNAPASYNTLPQVITVEARNNGGTVAEASDIVTVVGIKPGTDGTGANAYTIVLSNEAHTLSTDNLGNVVYTGSGTTIDVYDGTTQLNSVSGTPGAGQYSVTPSVISGTVTVGTPIDVSGNTAIVPDHSSMSTDDAVIRYSVNIENTLTLTKDQSLSKAIEGADGIDGQAVRTVNIYNLNDSTIPSPQNWGTFNQPVDSNLSADGWSLNVPTLSANNDIVYVSTRTFTNDAASPQDPTWSTPTIYSQRTDGVDGADGIAIKSVNMYKLNDSTVGQPTAGTFADPLSGQEAGWSLTVPSLTADGDQVYVSTRSFTFDGSSPQDPSWSTPTIYAQRTDGATGATGQAVRTVNMYNLNDNTVADTTGGTFNSPISGTNSADGWTLDVPSLASNGDIVYVTTRTFTDDAASPQDPSWPSPTIYAQRTDGAGGAAGQAVRTVNMYNLNDNTVADTTGGTFETPISATNVTDGWTLSVPALTTDGDNVYVSTRTFTDDAASPQDPSWSTPTVYATRTDGVNGVAGQAVRTVNIYKLNDSTIGAPTAGTFNDPLNGQEAGWSLDVPALASNNDQVYVSTRTFTNDAASPQDPSWSTPSVYAQRTDGADGAAGQAVRTVNMYNLNDNTVADTSGGTFNTPISATNVTDGWTLDVPSLASDGDIVYVSTRTFTDDAASPQDPSWSTPTIYAQRTDGATGATGQAVRTVNMYNLNDNTVADTSGGTFATPINGTNAGDGWTLSVPALTADGDTVYVSTRTFTDDAASPQDPSWSTPTIYAQRTDGNIGLTGQSVRTVNMYNKNDNSVADTTGGTFNDPISATNTTDGWTLNVPSLTANNDVVYVTTRTFTDDGQSPQDPSWGTVTVYSQRTDGNTGATGQAVRTVNMYNLNDNTVADTGGGTFNDPISATNITDGWSLNVPTMTNDGDTVYVSVRTFTDDGQSPQDPTWGTPTIYATRQDGINSVGVRQVNIYNLNDGTLPNTTDGTYDTPISGTFAADGWTLGVPTLTNDGDVIYTSSRTFTSGGLSPQDPNWATPTVYSARVDGKVGFGHNLFFSATDKDTVAWTTGSIYKADGTVYNGIVAGNTPNMAIATPTYIYFDSDVSTTVLQTTTSVGNAVGANRILLAYAEYVNTADTEAVFQVFGGRGGVRVHADQIVANSITSNQINATFYTGRVFTGGTFQTREPSDSSPYATTPRAVITADAEPYIGLFLPDATQGDQEVFGLWDVGGEIELRMVGDFATGSIGSGQMFSTAGLTDLRLRLGVPEPGGGEFGGTITRCPPTEYIPTTSTDTPIIGTSPDPENYNTGGALNTITFTLYDYAQRTGSSNNPYTAPQWSGDVYYSTTSSTGPWTAVPGGFFTCTGTATNSKEDASAPWVNTLRLNCTETVAWDTTGTISAGAPVWFMLRTSKDSGDHNNPRITALQASEPIANNFVDQLNEMTDVTLTSPTDGALLIYDTGTSLWRDQAMSGDATINDTGVVSLATNSVSTNEINATGTPSASTYLRGDMSWQSISTVPASTGADHVLRGNGSGGWAEATNIEFATTGNIRLPNSVYYQGKTTGGVNVDIMGMNSSNWFEIGDPSYNAQYDAALHKFSNNIEVAGGVSTTVRLDDSVKLNFGTSNDMSFTWNGATNDLEITTTSAGAAIEFHDAIVTEWYNSTDTEYVSCQHTGVALDWIVQGGNIDAWRIREVGGTMTCFALESGIEFRMGTGNYTNNYGAFSVTSSQLQVTGTGTMNTLYLNMQTNNVRDNNGTARKIGFNVLPRFAISSNYTLSTFHQGWLIHKSSGVGVTVTCPNTSQATLEDGGCWLLHNDDTENLTITATSPGNLYLLEAGGVPTAGDVTVEAGGIVTIYKVSNTEYWVWGSTAPAGSASTITVADESADTTCYPVFVTAATGSLPPKTDVSGLIYNSSSQQLQINGGINLNNANAVGVGALTFNDPGPGEGISWSGGNFSIYESPDNLTTNSAGNLQFVDSGVHLVTIDAAAGGVSIWNSGGTDRMKFSHDGTDFNMVGTNTTELNITGITNLKTSGNIYPDGQTIGNIQAVTGQYGSIQVDGADGSGGTWTGVSIAGGLVFMQNNGTTTTNRGGIYDDLNNQWVLQYNTSAVGKEVRLYHLGTTAIGTQTYNGGGNTCSVYATDHGLNTRDLGFNDLRKNRDNPVSFTVDETDIGAAIYADDNTTFGVTLPTSTTAFPVGAMTTIINANTSGAITVNDVNLYALFYLDGSTRTDVVGSCTVGPGGVANIWRQQTGGVDNNTPTYIIWGSGISA